MVQFSVFFSRKAEKRHEHLLVVEKSHSSEGANTTAHTQLPRSLQTRVEANIDVVDTPVRHHVRGPLSLLFKT